jgi:hypothetical protein
MAGRSAELLQLSVERLPIGADAGVSGVAILRPSFDHIFCKPQPSEDIGPRQTAKGGKRPFAQAARLTPVRQKPSYYAGKPENAGEWLALKEACEKR